MPAYHPPFQLTHRMTALVADIAERLGAWKAANRDTLVPALRRGNRVRTLQASLAIEQNTLSVEQVTAVLAGKPVLGSPKEIRAVRNAFAACEAMENRQPHRLDDLRQAYGLLIAGKRAGRNAGESAGRTTAAHPEQILAMLRNQPELPLAEVARAIGRAPSTVERAVARLQQQGRLRHVGPKKGGRGEVLQEGAGSFRASGGEL